MNTGSLIVGSFLFGTFLSGNGLSLYLNQNAGKLAHDHDIQPEKDGDKLLGNYANAMFSVSVTGIVFSVYFFSIAAYMLFNHWNEWTTLWKVMWLGLISAALTGFISMTLDLNLVENFGSLQKDGDIKFSHDSTNNFSMSGKYVDASKAMTSVSLFTSTVALTVMFLAYFNSRKNSTSSLENLENRPKPVFLESDKSSNDVSATSESLTDAMTLESHQRISDRIDRMIEEQMRLNGQT